LELSEQEIIALILEPSSREAAFKLLLKKYQQRIYWHIRKMVIDHDDADDVTQETFIKVWTALPNFRGDSKLFTWIYRIATNECLNFLEKKKRKHSVSINGEDEEFLTRNLESSSYIDGTEVQMKLQKAILTLPEKQRLVFNMKYFDDVTYEEMSEILETSVGALKSSYHFAVKKIESYFAQQVF
jgi:RNA polymerase sigma-70 factor (ECF subfamily)